MLRAEVVEENREKFKQALIDGFKLSVELSYVTPVNIAFMVSSSVANARKLAEEVGYITSETLPSLLMKAVSVASKVFNAARSSE